MDEAMDEPVEEKRDEARAEKKRWRTPVLIVANVDETGAKFSIIPEQPAGGPAS